MRRGNKILFSIVIPVSLIFIIMTIGTTIANNAEYSKDGICDLCEEPAEYEHTQFVLIGQETGTEETVNEFCYLHAYVWSIGNPSSKGAFLEAQVTLIMIFFASVIITYFILDMGINSSLNSKTSQKKPIVENRTTEN